MSATAIRTTHAAGTLTELLARHGCCDSVSAAVLVDGWTVTVNGALATDARLILHSGDVVAVGPDTYTA
jgi:hypothetical protein